MPVAYGDSEFISCIPKKCSKCEFLFEGECTRALNQVSGYLALDYGPCKVDGDTSPELIAELHVPKIGEVYVPKKCIYCIFLSFNIISGFICSFEREKWGNLQRALDWGNWSPDFPNVGLASGKIVSMDLIKAVYEGKEAEAINIFREINKETSIKEARDDFKELKGKLNNL